MQMKLDLKKLELEKAPSSEAEFDQFVAKKRLELFGQNDDVAKDVDTANIAPDVAYSGFKPNLIQNENSKAAEMASQIVQEALANINAKDSEFEGELFDPITKLAISQAPGSQAVENCAHISDQIK